MGAVRVNSGTVPRGFAGRGQAGKGKKRAATMTEPVE